MNHKFNTFGRCEYCGIIKSSANAGQVCVGKDNDDDSLVDTLVSAATMATFTSLFEPNSSGSDDFGGGGGSGGGAGSSEDY